MTAHKAQSILEFSILGAIIIAFLAIFLSYGLNNNYTQQIHQRAFRKASSTALDSVAGRASYQMVRDRHSVGATDAFGVGSVSPFSGAYSITRDYQMQMTPDHESEIPHMYIDVNGKVPGGSYPPGFLTQGFQDYCLGGECDETAAYPYQKYNVIFGEGNVWFPDDYSNCVRVIDSCEGEILDYDTCKAQCRAFTQQSYCVQLCVESRSAEAITDCANICAADVEIPPYCASLDTIFGFLLIDHVTGGMGLQSDYKVEFIQNSALRKREDASGVYTDSSIRWQNIPYRKIIFKPYHSYGPAAENSFTAPTGESEDVGMGAQW